MSSINTIATSDVPLSTDVVGATQRPGTNTKGFAYEAKICALFGLKGLIQNHFTNFSILQNVHSPLIGKFDDILFVACNPNGEKTEFFFQLKQTDSLKKRQNVLNSIELNKNDRSNKLYLPDYLKIIEKSQSKNYRYIIFTDRPVDDTDSTFELCNETMYPPMFNLNGKVHKLKSFPTAKPATLDKLLIFSNQPPEEDIDYLIESLIRDELHVHRNDAEDVRRKYVEFIQGWMDGNYGGFRPLSNQDIVLKVINLTITSNLQNFDLQLSFMKKPSENYEAISREKPIIMIEDFHLSQRKEEFSLITESTRQTLQRYTLEINWEKPVVGPGLLKLEEDVLNKHLAKYMPTTANDGLTLEILHKLLSIRKNQKLLLEIFDWFITERGINRKKVWETIFSDEELNELNTILVNTDVKVTKIPPNTGVKDSQKWTMKSLYGVLKSKSYCEVLTQIVMCGVKRKRFLSDDELKDKLSDNEHKKVQKLYLNNALQIIFGQKYKLTTECLWWYLWYEGKVPLILSVKDSSADFLATLLPKTSQSYVLISDGTLVSTWKKLKETALDTLYNFEELTEENRKRLFDLPMTLQGRECKFGQVISNDLLSNIKMSDISKLLLGKFCVGAKNYLIPSIFIPRRLHKVVVSDKVFSQSVKFVFMCQDENNFKNYITSNEPKICYETDVLVISKRSTPSSSNSDSPLHCDERFDEGNIFLVLDFSVKDIESAIKKRDVTKETYYLYSLVNDEIISHQQNPTKTINVIIISDEALFNKCLSDKRYDTYTISEIQYHKIPITCINIKLLKNECSEFTQRHKTINFLFYSVFDNNSFEFIGSTKYCSSIRAHIKPSAISDSVLEINTLLQYNNFILINGEPGMGKSVIVNFFTLTTDHNFFIVFIECNSAYEKFGNVNFEESFDIFNYFELYLNYDNISNIEKLVFRSFTSKQKVVLIVDGFDEIRSEFEDSFCNFLFKAKSLGLKIIITTRSMKAEFLQNKFSAISRTLVGFTPEDQIDYLKQFLNEKFINESDKIERFVEDTIINKRNSAWDSKFAGIALQTYMLSIIYAEEFKKCLKDKKSLNFINNPFNILDLYRKFIDVKIKFFKSKFTFVENSSLVPFIDNSIQFWLDQHKHCALKLIFNTIPPNVNIIELIKILKTKEGNVRIGLIDKFLSDEVPIFVHRTYAEYLCSVYISENYHTEFCQEIYKSMLKNEIYDTVRQLTDRHLADGNELHLAILNNDLETSMANLISIEHCGKSDRAGRLPLHIAMAWGVRQELIRARVIDNYLVTYGRHSNPYKEIITKNAVIKLAPFTTDLLRPDNICYYNALDYGFKTMCLQNVNSYLGAVLKTFNNFNLIRTKFLEVCKYENSEFLKRTLYTCCLHNYNFIFQAMNDLKPDNINLFEISFDRDRQMNLLHVSSCFGANDVIELCILKNQIDINSIDNYKWNALLYAIWSENQNTVKLLLENEADPNLANIYGQTPYSISLTRKDKSIAKIIEDNTHDKYKKKPKLNELHEAIITENEALLKQLLDRGEDPNQTIQSLNETPLILASGVGNLQIVQLLLAAGAEANKPIANGETALMRASYYGRTQIVQHLLEKKVNVNLVNNDGLTAFHGIACYVANEETCIEIAELLLHNGARVNSPADSLTPLINAACFGNAPLVTFLLSKGVNVHAKFNNTTALDFARYNEHIEIVNILEEFLLKSPSK